MGTYRKCILQVIAWVLALSAALSDLGLGQRQQASWSATARFRGDVRYDDNPFLLTSGQRMKLDGLSAADQQGGRFTDMESVQDVIPVPSLELAVEGPGLFGRTFALEAWADYEANLRNVRRRHAELGASIAQALSQAGRLKLSADWRPAAFSKNYLADAVDANADGDIAAEERRYAAGISHELDLSLSYRHRLVRPTKSRPLGVTGALEATYFDRRHEAPFFGRSRRGPGAGAALGLELGRGWLLGLDYAYASLRADTAREVLILNENDFGRDFNGNGTVTDPDARAFELVDRSRTERNLGLSVRGDLSNAASAELAYARRTRHFSSTQPYDVVDRGRQDARDEFSLDLAFRLARDIRLSLGARRALQHTNRAGDPASTGEVADYTRNVVVAGLQYRF